MISTIFLDAGGVILDESEFEERKAEIITRIIQKYTDYSLRDYWSDAEEAVYRFVSSTYEYMLFKKLGNTTENREALKEYKKQWISANIPYKKMDGIEQLLERISEKFRIGILGQYDASLVDYLTQERLIAYFTYRETQETYPFTKPDPRYFIEIIKNAKALPNECLMIGDRIDKDIFPSNIVGMKSIRVKTGLHRNQEPRILIEVPSQSVCTLHEITVELIDSIDNKETMTNPFWLMG